MVLRQGVIRDLRRNGQKVSIEVNFTELLQIENVGLTQGASGWGILDA